MFISSQSVHKHGGHRQFLFLIGRFLKSHLLWNHLVKWTETWVGSIYRRSFIKIDHFGLICLQTCPPQAIFVSDCPISKKSFPLKLHGQMNQNLVDSVYRRSSIKMFISAQFVNKDGHHRQFLFGIGRFLKKYSSLKPLGQINRNLIGSIYGRSSIAISLFIPIRSQTWSPQAILISDWLISKNLLLWNCFAKWTETW